MPCRRRKHWASHTRTVTKQNPSFADFPKGVAMNDTLIREDFTTRSQKVAQYAQNLFQSKPDWVTFFREVLGISGAARKLFPTQQEFIAFENTDEFKRIQMMVSALRGRKGSGIGVDEPTKVITVRLPESLHEALKAEANDHSTSMNKLCISKLLQVLSQVNQPSPVQARAHSTPATPTPATPAPTPQPASHSFQNRPVHNPQMTPSQPTPQRFGNQGFRQ